MSEHLVVIMPHYLNMIMAGRKTVECRASKCRHVPYLRVHAGDLLWFKQTSGMVFGSSKALWINSFLLHDELSKIDSLRRRWQRHIRADRAFWRAASEKPYWTLIGLSRFRMCMPFAVNKRDRRAWVVITPAERWWPEASTRRQTR